MFPASEGFFQTLRREKRMLLLLNAGIFYEFVKSDEFYSDKPRRYTIGELSQLCFDNSTNAGLWGYNIGDTVHFIKTVSIIVSGRIKHYISALNT
jgi:hypothetical protein